MIAVGEKRRNVVTAHDDPNDNIGTRRHLSILTITEMAPSLSSILLLLVERVPVEESMYI